METVVKAFYAVRRERTKKGQVKEVRLSRDFHVRAAAEEFAELVNIGVDKSSHMRAFVKEHFGLDDVNG